MKVSPAKKGRPSKFDRQQALQQAMLCFWQHGYEGTSISRLTEAMGINAPSLYASFGDKKQLFLQAVELYLSLGQADADGLERLSAKMQVHQLLSKLVVLYTGQETPAGCLVGTSALSVAAGAEDIQAAMAQIRQHSQAQLQAQIQQDISCGLLPADTDAEALADFTMATMQGLSTLARDGASRARLQSVVELSLSAWPESTA